MTRQELIKETVEKKYRNDTGCICADESRINALCDLLEKHKDINGVMIEVGVWRGGLAKIMAEVVPSKKLFLFDTFTGIPFTDKNDNFHKVGHFKETDIDFVKEFVGHKDRVEIVEGIFPESGVVLNNKQISIAHIDVDVYQSYKETLEFIYDKMSIGGLVVLDDYNVKTCEGATIAVDEFLKDKPEKIKTHKWQCYFVKE